ncbi:aspartic proteinase CDR1-like [Ananas comosus]|uniref:Aspartic proteinase CDR1-like n=1 Tax=Ananas comosus TaxID=4615 RepID=A0A6P5GQX0_ANACO|nr:aspartic proteinase CDR1-like [Ananas comosus]
MAQKIYLQHPVLLPAALLCIFPLLTTSAALPKGRGFSVELIDVDSKRSPFYDPKLTESQRIRRSVDLSKSYVLWLESQILFGANLTTIRPPLLLKPPATFMVAVSIGTGDGMHSYYLLLDTGSGLTWTQCLPCHTCFPQSAPIFNPTLSPTYRIVGCSDPLCKPPMYRCVNDRCEYAIRYGDNTYFASGVLSRETFVFQNAQVGRSTTVPNLAFGCTHSSHVNFNGNPAGIFGMNLNPTSMVRQLANLANGRFSYCLVPPTAANTSTFLRFGSDIKLPREAYQTTKILTYLNDDGHHFIGLDDISLNGRRLGFPNGTFERRHDRTGGCFVDTGARTTHLIAPAFDHVINVVKDYFRHHNLEPVKNESSPFSVCYKTVEGVDRYMPSMTLHLEGGAQYNIRWQYLFVANQERDIFCLALLSSNRHSVLGARQQLNTWMRYDTVHNVLSFAPHDCSHDANN